VTLSRDLATRHKITDDWGMDVVEELLEAVKAARASRAAANRDHEHVKELLIRARRERGDELGPADLEALTDRYLDRATISRLTAPEVGPLRKKTRRRDGD
jgi:hypothetical protein